MGRSWKPFVLAVILEFATVSFAHGRSVTFVSDAYASACLLRSYSVMPQFGNRHVDPNDPPMPDTDKWREADRGKASVIVSYVLVLELLLAVFAALGSSLMLVLAGIVVKLQERPARHAAPPKSSFSREAPAFLQANTLPAGNDSKNKKFA